MAQPFLTDQQILGQTPETADIARQRKIADLLTSQAFNQPQGGMVSGRYVAPSIAQQLQPLASALAGSYLSNKTDEKADALAKALRQKQAKEIEEFTRLQEADPGAALGYALSTNNPILQNLAKEELKGVKLGEGEVFTRPRIGGGVSEMRGPEKFRAPIQVDTGTSIEFRDPKDPTKVLQVVPKSQMPTAGQIIETENGPMLVNTRTGQAQPVMMGGQPIEGAGKPLTETQSNAVAFGARALEANRIATELENKGVTNIGKTRSFVGGVLGTAPFVGEKLEQTAISAFNPLPEFMGGPSPEQQQTAQARRNFISAVLRKESGAAISPKEYADEEKKYFPEIGDSQQAIEQKQEARRLAIKALEAQAGPSGKRQIQAISRTTNLSPQDQEALNWANSNPNDLRAAQIKQRLRQQ